MVINHTQRYTKIYASLGAVWKKLCTTFFPDFIRVYKVLPKSLQNAILLVFCGITVQTVLEVSAILAMSFLSISIIAPEKMLQLDKVSNFFDAFPVLASVHQEPRRFTLLMAALAALLIAIKNGVMALVSLTTTNLGQQISLFAGNVIFRHFLYMPYVKHLADDSKVMFQALSWRAELARMFIQLMSVYAYTAIIISMGLVLVFFTPSLVLLIIMCMGGIAAIIQRWLKSQIEEAGIKNAECANETNRVTLGAINGIREAIIYRQQSVFLDEFEKANIDGIPSRSFLSLSPFIPSWILETFGFITLFVSIGIMFILLDASMSSMATVVTMIMLVLWRVLPLFNRTLAALITARSARYAALRCLVEIEKALANPISPPPTPAKQLLIQQGISFQHVCFRHPNAAKDTLKNINVTIPSGKRVGIVGKSGAGKSTLALILSGLVQPTAGDMLIDGKKLDDSEKAAYSQRVGYVPQNPYILRGSLAENVTFSQWGKPWNKENVLRVCRMAELDVAVQRGIETPLNAGGAGLSGGQAQRLSIARALYSNPHILIFDEATSALDTGTEEVIMNTIFSLTRDITTIIIAHRLSTVEACDLIIWMDNGAIRMVGHPKDVLAQYELFLKA